MSELTIGKAWSVNSYAMNDQLLDELKSIIKAKQIACDELTRDQIAEAIRQAILAGDFVKLVTTDGSAQAVIYMPGRGYDAARSEIESQQRTIERMEKAISEVIHILPPCLAKDQLIKAIEPDAL